MNIIVAFVPVCELLCQIVGAFDVVSAYVLDLERTSWQILVWWLHKCMILLHMSLLYGFSLSVRRLERILQQLDCAEELVTVLITCRGWKQMLVWDNSYSAWNTTVYNISTCTLLNSSSCLCMWQFILRGNLIVFSYMFTSLGCETFCKFLLCDGRLP